MLLMVFQLRAIDQRRLCRRIGHLEGNLLEEVEVEIRHMLGL